LFLNEVQSVTLSAIFTDVLRQFLPLVLYLADLSDELMREHVNELAELLSHADKHISYIILPVGNGMTHASILTHGFLSHLLDLIESLDAGLVALVNEVYLLLINKTFDTSVGLLFLLPKVERHAVIFANLTRLTGH